MGLITGSGTRSYVAPEIVMGIPYDERVDMWSVGVILYVLLSGLQPFEDFGDDELFEQICAGKYHFHDECWQNVSMEAKELIFGLLVVDPAYRLSASQALRHSWFKTDDDLLASNPQCLKRFNTTPCFNAAATNTAPAGTIKAVINPAA